MRIENIRALRGPNVHHRKPVMTMLLQLEELTDRESCEFSGFNERLLELLPGLHKHHCAQGHAGAFVERLLAGTFFGHIVEHVALELAAQLDSEGTYGKTRHAGEDGLYLVVVRYDNEAAMTSLLRTSVQLVEALLAGAEFDLHAQLERARQLSADTELGPSTRAIVAAAGKRGIPWRRLSDGSLVEFGQGVRRRRIQAAVTSLTSQIAVDAAGDKALTKRLLQEALLPVPCGQVVSSPAEAVELLSALGGPLVVKPVDGNQGRGVTLNVTNEAELRVAFSRAAALADGVLVEEQLSGADYRILVIDGRVIAASRREPCQVTGDGRSTVAQLIEQANRDPRRGEGHGKPLTRISFSADEVLPDLERVPAAAECVVLRQAANLSQGGTATDVTDEVHPQTRLICERAARVLGLDVCGLDLITGDISAPLAGGIIEVNASPGLRMHLHPSAGRPRPVGEAIVNMLYPPGDNGRIPVCSITGTNGKTTVTRLIGHILSHEGRNVGMTTTDGIQVAGQLVAEGDLTGPASAQLVLSDPGVEAAVLECARGGILRRGLGYDWSDVGVITNIRLDHVGQDGIRDIEDLVWIKSLIAERVREGGTLVLNAEDEESAGLKDSERVQELPRKVVLYSVDPANVLLRAHLAAGGHGYFVRNGMLVEAAPGREMPLARVDRIPLTMNGSARFQVSNCLAAAAAARALGVSARVIRDALQSFNSNRHNPGRINLWQLGGGYVVLDYGHNPDAFRAAAAMAGEWQRPVIAIAGVPGDRADSVIQEAGAVLAAGFSRLWIKEDSDLRGRQAGEVALQLRDAVLRVNPAAQCNIVLDEVAALSDCLDEVRAGATALLFFEQRGPVTELLQQAGARPVDDGEVSDPFEPIGAGAEFQVPSVA